MRHRTRTTSPRAAARLLGAMCAAVVLVSCGGGSGTSTTAEEEHEEAPPAPTKEEFDDLETRVLELEVEMGNVRAELEELTGGASAEGETAEGEHADEAAHWTYAEADSWAELDPDNAACGSGTEQSPIDLGEVQGEDLPNVLFEYTPVDGATVVDNGHTVQVEAPGAGKIVLDDQLYEFLQFHIHAPSEHTIEGERYPLEIHFVHKSAEGALAVIGVLVTEGEPWPAFDPAIVAVPLEENAPADIGGQLDLNAFLPELTAAYRYAGSLTTPPCSEGVKWVVLQGTIHMSAEQISKLTGVLEEPNARPVQPLNGREVVIDLSAS